jgi:cbb3-type cytochrome c oxidase subunit III
MNIQRISRQRFELVMGLLALACLALGLLVYALQEPARIAQAQAVQASADLDQAMSLYAENCSVCHGLRGEGIGATLPLDNPALSDSDPLALAKVIARGRYNTAMPAWSKEDGGPLSDYQIEQLVLLIQQGDWRQVQDRVVNLGMAPKVPFTSQADPEILDQVKRLPEGDKLAQGITVYATQCVACHGADGTGSKLAPALNDPLVREKGAIEIERTIQNGVPGALMSAWKNVLSPEELAGAVALIMRWQEVPSGAIPMPDQPVPVTDESLALGQQLFASNCSRCHGPEGQGTPRAPSLNVKSYLEQTGDTAIQQIITHGVPGTAMPVWGDRLADSEIQAIVGFIRSWQPTAPAVATLARGGGGPWWAGGGQSNTRTSQAVSAFDWRVLALSGAVVLAAALLIGLAWDRLRKLPV